MALTFTRQSIPVPLPMARGGTEATTAAGARTTLGLGDVALLTAPGGTTTFLRADKTWTVPAGGGGGAPTDAEYITSTVNASLSAERVLTDTGTITWDRTVAGQIKANVIGGGGGSGDLSSNTALSVDNELAVFSGTTGKLVKRGTGSGLAWIINGVLGVKTPVPTGALVGTTDAQTLTGKTISGVNNTLSIREADLALTDVTTRDVSTSQHGFVPKAPGGTTAFLRGDATWAVPAGGGGGAPTDAEYITSTVNATLSAERVLTDTATVTWDRSTPGQIKATATGVGGYTNEEAQDAIGAILLDTPTIDLTYDDATPTLSAAVVPGSITTTHLANAAVTYAKMQNVTDARLLGRSAGSAGDTQELTVGTGLTLTAGVLASTVLSGAPTDAEYITSIASASLSAERVLTDTATITWDRATAGQIKANTIGGGGGESFWEHSPTSTLLSGLLAFWRMEEATGNRVDSVASLALTPQGTTAQITTAAGKTGQALRFLGAAEAYLSIADNATLSAGTSSLTFGLWVYFDAAPQAGWGIGGKGNTSLNNNGAEYEFFIDTNQFKFLVGNGGTHTLLAYPGVTPTLGQWYFLVGWYDAVLDMQYFQVNNGTIASAANTAGSFDSAGAFEIARQPGWAGSPAVNMRVDNPFFYKRLLTDTERSQHWNSGAGLDYPLGLQPVIYPTTLSDHVGIGTESATEWLEVAGAVKLGTALGTADGTLRWSGTDFEGRKGGAWVSMTGAGGGSYTDEQAQDAVGTILVDTATIDLTYTDATPSITAAIVAGSIGTTQLTNDAVTYAKIQNVSATDRLLGRVSAGAGDIEELVCTPAGRALLDAADTAAQRTTLGLGTLAPQDASAVAITGGTAVLTRLAVFSTLPATNGDAVIGNKLAVGTTIDASYSLKVGFGAKIVGAVRLGQDVTRPESIQTLIGYPKTSAYGLWFQPSDNDTGGHPACLFANVAGLGVGTISTNATTTSYNTTSDSRLKHAVAPLTGALDAIAALRPVAFRWNADESQDEGFLAHELQQVMPHAVTGEPDAVHDDGSVKPQQVDHSRLVPWLTAALQETLAQVTALRARVQSLEEQLGV